MTFTQPHQPSAAPATLLRLLGLAIAVALALLGLGSPASAQCNGRWLTSPEQLRPGLGGGAAPVVVMPNGDLVVGGSFTSAGGSGAVRIARWNGVSWSPPGSGMTGGNEPSVTALAVLPNGDLIAGGVFTTAGGVTVNNIARWNGSAWSAMGSGLVDVIVQDIVVMPNGDIIVGGILVPIGGGSRAYVARWSGVSWVQLGPDVLRQDGGFAGVYSLAVLPNGDLIVGGRFGFASGVSVNNIVRWDGSAYTPLGTVAGFGSRGEVFDIEVLPNGDILAGCGPNFTQSANVFRFNGTSWAPLGSGANQSISGLAVLPNGDLVAGGDFTMIDGVPASRIARWNGSSWASLGPGANAGVRALTMLSNGDLIATGSFTIIGDVTVNRIARWNGSSWTTLGSGINGDINALAVLPGGDVVAGGSFVTAGGTSVNRIARWNGWSWAPLGPGMNGEVRALTLLPNADLVAGGSFAIAGGVPAGRIARWNGSSWEPLGSGTNGEVRALAVLPNGDLIAGGQFTTAGGVVANHIARWDGSVWAPLGSGLNNAVSALIVLPGGHLIAGGSFTSAGGVTANGIARWNGASWEPLGSGMGGVSAPFVSALAVLPNGDLVAGGRFTTAGGAAASNIARWSNSAWSPLGAGLANVDNVFAVVNALAVLPGGQLVAGGQFTNAAGATVNSIARWNGSSWGSLGSGMTGFNSSVRALAVRPGGDLVAGGLFIAAGGTVAGSWARWTDTGIPWVARQPAPASTPATRIARLSATLASGYDFSGPITFQWFRDGQPITNGPAGASPSGGDVTGATGALPRPTSDPTTTITIINVQPSDAGAYTVTFTNSCGTVTSAPATLTITTQACNPADITAIGGPPSAPDGLLTGDDFVAFISAFAAGDLLADIVAIGGVQPPDGLITGDDFNAFIAAFASGCP
ncbi:MAG: hypothetical protein LW650_14250 [Planctomycetaceae bacterium]|jgi:hypothetical protein|nr:hypothetical protein [Phycisphaerales bacterium]MCE2654556.1 hypothetical protein [Planctomycetaceae bacterium]